jgi:hypothetical protein
VREREGVVPSGEEEMLRQMQPGEGDMVKGLLAVLCCIAIASCAAGAKKAAMSEAPPAATHESSPVMAADPHAQIEQLEAEIETSRNQLQLPEPPPQAIQSAPTQPMGAMTAAQDPKCKPAATDTCKTSCTLSDSICGNADKICNLAKQLPGDNWAANKCAKANTTCESSRTKCCGCQ